MRGRYIILSLVAIVSVSDFFMFRLFWLSEAGGMRLREIMCDYKLLLTRKVLFDMSYVSQS